MSDPAVSVVIPTYRAAAFIRTTLDSVAAQTRPPAEVVVADDHSPDDTVGVVRDWAKAAPFPVRVVELRQNSGGPAGPLNAGIRAARGELIAPLDHDDLMEPDKLQRQVAALAAAPDVGLVFHRSALVGDLGGPLAGVVAEFAEPALAAVPREPVGPDMFRLRRADAYRALVRVNFVLTCSSLLCRKATWRQVGGFDTGFRRICDYAFAEAVARRADFGFIDRPLVRWRRHDGCLSDRDADAGYAECWRLLGRFRPDLLDPPAARLLAEIRADREDHLHGQAYQHRRAGRPAAALALYRVLFRGRPTLRYAAAAGRSAAASLLARLPAAGGRLP